MLQSHLHSLIAKAHRYQEEPERFERSAQEPLTVKVHGANGDHEVVLQGGHLECDCDGFAHRGEGICAHVLGVEHHFRDQLAAERGQLAFCRTRALAEDGPPGHKRRLS